MGRRGPIPLEFGMVSASRQSRRRNAPKAVASEGEPIMPDELDEPARRHWARLVAAVRPGLLGRSDAAHLGLAAQLSADVESCRARFQTDGCDWESQTAKHLLKLQGQLAAVLAKLGMNPVDRHRLPAPSAADRGRIEKFIAVS